LVVENTKDYIGYSKDKQNNTNFFHDALKTLKLCGKGMIFLFFYPTGNQNYKIKR